ncbi:MAG TPA: hypothetical protein VKU89_09495 [Solirubrobacteraceae bacterium]|nr:hypothetical protein [Solirubrobacteraceae bacterium]
MQALAGLLAVLLVVIVLAIVSGPLRAHLLVRDRRSASLSSDEEALRRLEAEREARYRELRDAELDYRTGKLRSKDYEVIRENLRREALAILDAIEATRARLALAAPAADQGVERRSEPARPSADLEQGDRVAEQQHREQDRPAV